MRKRVRAEDRGNQAEQGNEGTGQSREQREPGRAAYHVREGHAPLELLQLSGEHLKGGVCKKEANG